MTSIEVKNILKENLSTFLLAEGFKYSSEMGGGGFKKKTPYGFLELVYGINDYNTEFIIPGIGYLIRFDVIENICVKFNQIIDEISDVKKQATVMGGYGGLINVKHHDFGEMRTVEDVKKVSQVIQTAYLNTLKPFMEQRSDIHFLEQEINQDTERDLPYILYWRGRRSMRGIILAKLCQNPRYEELKEIYRQKCIEQQDPEVLDAYDKLTDYLDNEYQQA